MSRNTVLPSAWSLLKSSGVKTYQPSWSAGCIGNKYLADTEPWKLAKTDLPRVGSILNLCLQIAANLAIVFEPFLPFTARKLRKMLA
ncbi:MAG: hypothetical protein ACOX1Q_10905, partial [Eubacteriales bacterium]